MRKDDLTSGLLVAVRDYDSKMERAEVLEVGDSREGHLVEFKTGAHRGETRRVMSREILVWHAYEEQWEADRREALRHEASLALMRHGVEQALQTLETVKTALAAVGVEAGIGQLMERNGDKMERHQALFITAEQAEKLLPVVADKGLQNLLT